MRNFIIFVAFALCGCAPVLTGNAPEPLKMAYSDMYRTMRYDYLSEHQSGRDMATSGCPTVGDCEDVAFCLVEKLRKLGKSPSVEIYRWKKGAPWTHVMVRSDNLLLDYYGIFENPNDRVQLKATCKQVYTATGKPDWSSAGAWVCTPADPSIGLRAWTVF